MNKVINKFPSQLRYDLVSKDWVVIATGRAKRPEMFKKDKRNEKTISKAKCPFCNLKNQIFPTLISRKNVFVFKEGEDKKTGLSKAEIKDLLTNWTTLALPNLFPAVFPTDKLNERQEGHLYKTLSGAGFHEVILTKDHKKHLALLSQRHIKELIDVYQSRYLDLMDKKFVGYISIFHNHGREAGASQTHPHSQILTTPLIDAGLRRTLETAQKYFQEKGSCVYCQMNNWEKRAKKRLVFENKNFLVVCPFASKAAFEMVITPKKHLSYFERITEEEKLDLAEALKQAMGKLNAGLNNPPYNFYLHTAPCDEGDYPFYHWHFTILPKTTTPAGFEFGTGIEISVIEPEKAADYLKKQKPF